MRNFFFLTMTLFQLSLLNAQTSTQAIQTEIDQTVWKPFQQAFQTLDGVALNATYADQVLRVTPSGIDTKNSFKKSNLERFAQNKAARESITLDFWFDSRRTQNDISYEVGFYRIGFTDKNGKTAYSYGQFHIVLQKINGQWKITQDWDTATMKGKPITATDFELNTPLKF